MSFPWEDDAFAMVLPEVIERLEPDPAKRAWRLSVRVEEPENARRFGQEAVRATYPTRQRGPDWDTWHHIREILTEDFKLFATFLGIFGVVSMGAAAFVIVNVVGGQVLARVRDIGLLKAVGFTPTQVAVLLLVEHVSLSLPAAALGVGIGFAASPSILRIGAGGLGTLPTPVLDPTLTVATVLGVPLAIAAITLLPAWRGGQVPTVQALTTGLSRGHSRPSRVARLASRLRLPAVIAMGIKDIFSRPLRGTLTVAALTGTVVLGMFTVGMDATLRDITEDPRLAGAAGYEVTIKRGPDPTLSDIEVRELIESRSEVDTYRPQRQFLVNFEGADGGEDVFGAGAIEGDPAPLSPSLTGGRLFSGPGEAIISRELAELAGTNVGDRIALEVNRYLDTVRETPLKGKRLDLRVVGIYLRGGLEALFDLDTVRLQAEAEIEPHSYAVKLVDAADPEAFKAALIRQTTGRLRIEVYDASEDNRQTADIIRPALYGITGALLAIGAVNLLITMLFGIRERYRDFGIMKTLGFTPRQIIASVSVSAVLFAIVAIAVGTPLGLVFTRFSLNFIGEESGFASPFGTMPGPGWIALLAAITVVVAIAGAWLPARRAAGISVTEALRYE